MAETETGATARLAEWICQQRTDDLPPYVPHQSRRLFLDHLGAAVPGAATGESRALRAYLGEVYAGDEAVVVGAAGLSAPGAAYANAAAAHSQDLDDGYTPGGVHPSSPTLPAVLAAAQRHRVGPDRTLLAAAVAVEVTCRVAAAGHPAIREYGFHNTCAAGVFGAAAGVSVLLGLDARRTAYALGLAGSHAGGLMQFLHGGDGIKRMHAGRAARDGLTCAELAARGISGPADVLEGRYGYFATFARGSWDPSALVDDLGEVWRMTRTYVKPYPGCRDAHGPVDAALRLRHEHGLTAGDVAQATVATLTRVAARPAHEPDTAFNAQMSIPYNVAVAFADGEVGLAQFGDDRRADPGLLDLADRIGVEGSAECDRQFPSRRPSILTVLARDGRTFVERVENPVGEPDNPMSDEALTAKFVRQCAPVLGTEDAEALADVIWRFDDLAALDRALRGERRAERTKTPDVPLGRRSRR
ncbi:MmgE/PrpD family protein [Phytohabitans kaempferiae]|uniref:MmgE/PrpD family protein n=1 Tax=Phytohabitans kaempferiae TaxID=1620943 RepID=A0ABV6MFR0_9ACTN